MGIIKIIKCLGPGPGQKCCQGMLTLFRFLYMILVKC